MPDAIKSPWKDYAVDVTDTGGAGVVSRGSDPNFPVTGTDGLQPLWSNQPVPTPGGEETSNSVSGLPARPNRNEPTGTPPGPPSLQDRMPGTIDER